MYCGIGDVLSRFLPHWPRSHDTSLPAYLRLYGPVHGYTREEEEVEILAEKCRVPDQRVVCLKPKQYTYVKLYLSVQWTYHKHTLTTKKRNPGNILPPAGEK